MVWLNPNLMASFLVFSF